MIYFASSDTVTYTRANLTQNRTHLHLHLHPNPPSHPYSQNHLRTFILSLAPTLILSLTLILTLVSLLARSIRIRTSRRAFWVVCTAR